MILETVARGVLAGEAMHPAGVDYRVRLLSPKRQARIEVLHAFDREHDETTPIAPYSHSSPPGLLQAGAGENTEWFVFAAQSVADVPDGLTARWDALARADGRFRVGTRIALANLRHGLRPPQSGHDNPHYFDDLAMVRAVAIAAATGGSDTERVARDAHITHDLEGVDCAVAAAVLVDALARGSAAADAVDAAIDALPPGGWSRRLAIRGRDEAKASSGPLDLAQRLGTAVCDWIYSYPVAAPETLAVLLAHTVAAASPNDLLLGAQASGRSGTTLGSLAGVTAALRFGEMWIPPALDLELPLTGIAVPSLAGRSIRSALAADET